MMQWHYVEDGKSIGPVEEGELNAFAAAGKISGDTLVWHEGMPEWVKLSSLKGSAEAQPPPEPQPEAETKPQMGTKLSIKREKNMDAPTGTGVQDTTMCCECGKQFFVNDMLQYEGAFVCSICKPTFLKRVQKKGGPATAGGTGATPNRDIIPFAKDCLSGNWGMAVGMLVLLFVIQLMFSALFFLLKAVHPTVGAVAPTVVSLLVTPPFLMGLSAFFLAIAQQREPSFGMVMDGFKKYGGTITAYFLMSVLILLPMTPMFFFIDFGIPGNQELSKAGGIVTLVCIIGVVIVSYMFSMTFFVLADNPSVGGVTALNHSRLMMKGMKWKFFCLNFRIFWWVFGLLLLSAILMAMLTPAMGPVKSILIFVGFYTFLFIRIPPILATAYAVFYEDAKGRLNMG